MLTLRRILVLAAVAAAFAVAYHARPTNAAIIDRLTIKNETTDAVVQYHIDGPLVGTNGCLRHRQTFTDGYAIKPVRVHFRVFKTMFECPNNGKSVYDGTFNYWQPETTYVVTGSPHYYNSINVKAHH